MGENNLQIGKIHSHIIHIYWVAEFQPHPVTATHTGPHTGLTGVEQSDATMFLNRFIEGIGHAVIRIEPLECRMELEPANAVILHQAARLTHPHLSLPRVDRGKGDQNIAVGGGDFGHFFICIAAISGFTLGIDGKNNSGDILRTIMSCRFFNRRRMLPGGTEIFRHRGLQLIIAVIGMIATWLLGMGMDINGTDTVEIDHRNLSPLSEWIGSCTGHNGFGS